METQVVKWCTFGAWGKTMPTFIGKLEEQSGNTGKIRYGEKQMYPLEYWDMNFVMVFDCIEDAIMFMVRNNCDESVNSIREWLNFPTDAKKINWELLKALEVDMHKQKCNG